ncbi:hypothetical protein NAT51_04370 [Flavobacterium amniphilum]|uniref:hypothetical protein n=1 Tax=Flavobacterium amniphilum TaxID=1834035 RepID=UPI00202A14B9|nr:hypothetical protein [Flavobacterium amniphilum]MCL9804743.1 hypothetical protein [Flavobacterium amniphilum]
MEPNKLENQIREKLHGREIQPSANSWDRLDAMLTVQEEKKNRKAFPWLSIAASFFVLAGLGYFFLNQNQKNDVDANGTPSVVETNREKETKSAEDNLIQKDAVVISDKDQVVISNPKLEKQGKESKRQINNPESKSESSENKSSIAFQNEPKKDNNIQINTLVSPKEEVNPEALLAQVEKPKSEQKSKLKVDAKNLLSQVDGEIELTFRQKVLKTIKKNYQETKVALATRNQESSSNH